MMSLKMLRKLSRLRLFLAIIFFAGPVFQIHAQPGKNGQLRMTKNEILTAKSSDSTAPGSSNASGVQVIVIHGDPSAKGLYTILLKVAAHTTIAAHLHPDDRVATVIEGTWYFGYGDAFNKSKLKKLSAGSIYTEVEGQNHFAMTHETPVVVEITGYGPSGVTYVNTANDPKKSKN